MVNILAPILFVLFSCNRDSIEILPSRLDLPDQESWGVTILLTNEGIEPVNPLNTILKLFKFIKFPISGGIEPENPQN